MNFLERRETINQEIVKVEEENNKFLRARGCLYCVGALGVWSTFVLGTRALFDTSNLDKVALAFMVGGVTSLIFAVAEYDRNVLEEIRAENINEKWAQLNLTERVLVAKLKKGQLKD